MVFESFDFIAIFVYSFYIKTVCPVTEGFAYHVALREWVANSIGSYGLCYGFCLFERFVCIIRLILGVEEENRKVLEFSLFCIIESETHLKDFSNGFFLCIIQKLVS